MQTIHLKCQLIFSEKKKIKMTLAAVDIELTGAIMLCLRELRPFVVWKMFMSS